MVIRLESAVQNSTLTEAVQKVSGFVISPSFLYAVFVLLAGYAVYRILLILVKKAVRKSHINKNLHTFLISLFRILTLTTILMSAAATVGVSVNSFLVIFSALGLAVSLALQDILSNLAGGLILLLSKPFSIGDWIQISDVVGVVEATDILYTKILTFENRVVFLPNGTISTSTIQNYTMQNTRRLVLDFDIVPDCSIELVKKILIGAVKKNKYHQEKFEPVVYVTNLSGYATTYSLRVFVLNDDFWDFKFSLLEELKEQFDKHEILLSEYNLDLMLKKKQ